MREDGMFQIAYDRFRHRVIEASEDALEIHRGADPIVMYPATDRTLQTST